MKGEKRRRKSETVCVMEEAAMRAGVVNISETSARAGRA